MLQLDCHNIEKTYDSLISIFGLKRSQLENFLSDLANEENSVLRSNHYTGNLLDRLNERAPVKTGYDATCWFHLTRLPEGTGFSKGLRPLHDTLPNILDWLGDRVIQKVSRDSWQSFEESVLRGEIEGGTLKFRHGVSQQQGPFGWLVRDFAFHQSTKRDYFRRPPEAVEDLIALIRSRFDIDLTETYREHSNSFVVKFRTSDSAKSNLSAALYYLIRMFRGKTLNSQCATHISMCGQQVPPSDIVKVEEFPNPPPLKE